MAIHSFHNHKLQIVAGNPAATVRQACEFYGITTRVNNIQVMDMGTLRGCTRAMGTVQTSGAKEIRRKYLRYLTKKFWTAEIIARVCTLALWLAALDLYLFARNGESLIHPLLSVFIMAAVLSLIVVAYISISTTMRYLREVMEEG